MKPEARDPTPLQQQQVDQDKLTQLYGTCSPRPDHQLLPYFLYAYINSIQERQPPPLPVPTVQPQPDHQEKSKTMTKLRRRSEPSKQPPSASSRSTPRRATSSSTKASSSDMSGVSPSSGPKRQTKVQPLRRGDACLMCRAKKLKCSAEKPRCDQCSKRGDRCVFDTIRPASRVEKLEKKLAEIEEADRQAAGVVSRKHSLEALGIHALPSHRHSIPARTSLPTPGFSYAHGMAPYQNVSSPFPPQQRLTPVSASSKATSLPGPSNMLASWNWPTQANVRQPYLQSDPMPMVNSFQPLPFPLASSNTVNAQTSYWPQLEPSDPLEVMTPTSINDTHTVTTPLAPMASDPIHITSNTTFPSLPPPLGNVPFPMLAYGEFPRCGSSGQEQYQAVEEKDISQHAREYLLDLYFALLGSELDLLRPDESDFRARLQPGFPRKPHPSLLFAMYAVASSTSYIPAVRALSESLADLALRKIDIGVKNQDRLVDCLIALGLLVRWFQEQNRGLEARLLLAKGVALATEYTLDCTTDNESDTMTETDSPQHLEADEDDRESRSHAFWGIWLLDKSVSLTESRWISGFGDRQVTTPLPGLTEGSDKVTMNDVFSEAGRVQLSKSAQVILAVHLFSRAHRSDGRQLVHSTASSSSVTDEAKAGEIPDTASRLEAQTVDSEVARIVLLGVKMIGITRDSAADLDCEQILALGRQAVTLLRALSAPAQSTTSDDNGTEAQVREMTSAPMAPTTSSGSNGSTNSYTVDRSPKTHSGSSGIDSAMRAIVETPLSTIVNEMVKRSKALTAAGQLDGRTKRTKDNDDNDDNDDADDSDTTLNDCDD